MNENLLAQANEGTQLVDVDAALHDAAFSMADIRFDETHRAVQILFYKGPRTRDILPRGRSSGAEEFTNRLLTINHVVSFSAHDPSGLVEHSYARLAANAAGQLSLISNFPGRVDFQVSAIDVRVTPDSSAPSASNSEDS